MRMVFKMRDSVHSVRYSRFIMYCLYQCCPGLPRTVLRFLFFFSYPGILQDISTNIILGWISYDIVDYHKMFWDILEHLRPLGYPGISQDIPVNSSISIHSHVQHILLCPRMSGDILTRDIPSQLGYQGISQDISVNCSISKQSNVQRILLCPRTSRDILTRCMQCQLGHPGISQDISVNCCISKQSYVQHILLCPSGHPRTS